MTDNSDSEADKAQNRDVRLYTAEINQLKKALVENNSQLIAMEAACLRESDRHVELEDSLIAWQDKYERLHESHKRVQKVNQSLEDKLLKLVDRNASERAQLTSDVATLSVRLAQANYNIATLQREIERYKTDMGLAIQLLQCKPENFVSQKVTSLPHEMQTKLSQYIRVDTNSHSDSEGSTSGIGTATENAYHILPASDSPVSSCPLSSSTTASLVYGNGLSTKNSNANNADDQMISPLGMAKYLEDKLKAANVKHCDTCLCATRDLRVLADIDQTYSVGTQTILQGDFTHCLRCNGNLNSPSSTNSPFMLKLVKSCDSITSDAKSSISCAGSNERLLGKKDELTVNPILGHTPITDRNARKNTPNKIDTIKNTVSLDIQTKIRPSNADDLTRPKDTNRSNQQTGRVTASSSSSLSNRSSIPNVDGSKLFESFNRNLIKSIKAEKPNLSGPRLCALRLANGSGSILLDNIESDSTPVVYTRRNRFLDEELDETKDVITTHRFSNNVSNGCTDERTHHKISMLMTDGVVSTTPSDECTAPKSDQCSAGNIKCGDALIANGTDPIQNHEFDPLGGSQPFSKNVGTHNPSETNVIETNANKSELYGYVGLQRKEADAMNQTMVDHMHAGDIGSNELEMSPHPTLDGDIQSKAQLMHIHQLRQKHQMSFVDETSLLRRQQLNRVAEWVQNNSNHEPIHGSSDSSNYKQVSKFNNNSVDISPVDRNLKSLAMINCNNNNINNNNQLSRKYDILSSSSAVDAFSDLNMINSSNNDLEIAQKPIDYSHMNNNIKPPTASTMHHHQPSNSVDLAQMEYNVKQFLLKQNEWSSPKQHISPPPPPPPSSTVSVTHSMNHSLSSASSINDAAKLRSRSTSINDDSPFSAADFRLRGTNDPNRPSSQPSAIKNVPRTETNL